MTISDVVRLFLLAALWGASFLFMRIAVPAFGSVNVAFLRVLLGFAGLAAVVLCSRQLRTFNGKLAATLTLGIINSGLPFLMYCIAARWLPTGYSAIFNATAPMMGALVGFSFFGEVITTRKLIGIITGLAGIVIISSPTYSDLGGAFIAGALACLMATTCYGLAGYLTRRWITERGGLDPRMVALGSQAGASVFLLPFFSWSLFSADTVNWLQPHVWGSVAALGLICTALAYILYFRLIADIGPLKSLTVTFIIPPFACLWGYLVLDERIGEQFIAGACLIGMAVWMVGYSGKKMQTS
ncbi:MULTISPECIES: DMT family transporter [Pantoea]|uniref:DMT family transporter n=1 Tax=Pantoea TaxID=53335 RepID=UPI000F865A06|nr:MULTISPECIES: DMT family transporter [Pantoea]RTY52671.1 EamA/RhaT family transporter [Pantoea sp. YU22]WBV23241.1 DMT family transporter [Pantoea piersonii]